MFMHSYVISFFWLIVAGAVAQCPTAVEVGLGDGEPVRVLYMYLPF